MSESDLDSLYKSANEQDTARPSVAVRQAILDHARRLADEAQRKPAIAAEEPSRLSRWIARGSQLRWQIAGSVAAAALAMMVLLQPQLRSTLPAPARLQQSVPPASAARRSAPVPPAALLVPVPRPPSAPAPEPFPAGPQFDQSASSNTPAASSAMPLVAPAPPATPPSPNLASNADVTVPRPIAPAPRVQAPSSAAALAERERAQTAVGTTATGGLSPSDPLHEAAAQGDVARLRSLLQQSATPIDARDARGRTALMLAVLHGHEAVVRALLEQGADPNIGDVLGRTPLAIARERHQLPMVAALLQAGAR